MYVTYFVGDSNRGGGGFGGNNQSSGGFGGSGNGFGGDSGGFGGNNGFGAGGGSRPPSETTMFINGIPEGTTEQDVKDCIESQCKPKNIRLPKDKETGALRKKGYVDFETVNELEDALKMRFEINGEKLYTIKDGPRKLVSIYAVHINARYR